MRDVKLPVDTTARGFQCPKKLRKIPSKNWKKMHCKRAFKKIAYTASVFLYFVDSILRIAYNKTRAKRHHRTRRFHQVAARHSLSRIGADPSKSVLTEIYILYTN